MARKQANQTKALADQTELKILARAEELGYDPRRVASALGIDPNAHHPRGQHNGHPQPQARKTAGTTDTDAAAQQ